MGNLRVKIISSILRSLILVMFPYVASAQSSAENKKIFKQAETYYLYEEYELANQQYLLLDSPDNMNIKYKIGTCYLQIPGEKKKAIPYLEEAVKDASYDSKTSSYNEKRAPLEAYFSLAKAYMTNNDLEKGLSTLEKFKKLVEETESKGGMKNTGFIDQQIQACKNAMKLMEKPVALNKKLLGSEFSHGTINENPAVSFDGNTIAYTESHGLVNAIYCSRKQNGKWLTPLDITAELKAGEDCSTCSLNRDGTELFLYKTDNYDGAIYSSTFKNDSWTPIKKLNRNINTRFYESHAAISADGKKLYFTSNRDGGEGKLDIYVSELDATGDWGPAVNLGSTINTQFNEDTPFITENNSDLYFSSEGHNSMGGYDIFLSRKNGSDWDTPENIGYPINTSDDDKFFQPWNNGKNAYYAMTTGYKKSDIFYLILGGAGTGQFAEVNGKLGLSDTLMALDKTFSIHLIDLTSNDTVDVSYPNKLTGLYAFYVIPRKYRLLYTGPGYFPQSIDTTITSANIKTTMNIDIVLVRDPSSRRVPVTYDKINLNEIPKIAQVDTSTLIKNLNVNDLGDESIKDSDILYYTVQVMALYNPVDISYFKYIPDIRAMYNDQDRFYRYTTGMFQTREEAFAHRLDLMRKGYPEDIFIKKVSK